LNLITDWIKQGFSIVNLIALLIFIAWCSKRLGKLLLYRWFVVVACVLFLLCGTGYLPHYLAQRLEQQYLPLSSLSLRSGTQYHIIVLGSGTNADTRLLALQRLGITAQSRLLEAVRLYTSLPQSILVCSGGTMHSNKETQARTVQRSAMLLGIDSTKTLLLNNPLTTAEEVNELKHRLSAAAPLIVVTDAIHMPRAIKLFKSAGFAPFAAPANYRAPLDGNNKWNQWKPALHHLQLMDLVLHEYLAAINYKLFLQ
jgi:uncharacterized SAM-binding protein YcdF (DUF218 family)